jgi:hypothetical protein
MVKKLQVHAADLRGVNRLTIAGISGIVELVEAMHHNIAIIAKEMLVNRIVYIVGAIVIIVALLSFFGLR